MRVDRKRKQNATVLLKALGMTEGEIREEFAEYPAVIDTLEKDHVQTQDEALLDLYRKIRPGEPPTVEAGRALLENFYFNPKRYDLAKVGRYKVNKKLGQDAPLSDSVLSRCRTSSRRSSTSPRSTSTRPRCPARATASRSRSASRRTTSTTSATVASARSASSSRTRSARACPGWSASCASA